MRNTVAAVVGVLGLCAVVGCSSSNQEARDSDANRSLKDGSGGTVGSTGPAANPGPVAVEPVGVASCDAYLDRMAACIRKMPESGQASAQDGINRTRDAWRQAATSQGARAALDDACQKATAALAQNSYCSQ